MIRRGIRNPRRGQRPRRQNNQLRVLTNAVRDLTLVTQTRSLPMQRDVVPMNLPRVNRPVLLTRQAPNIEIFADSAGTSGAAAFTLDSLPNYTEITALFDQYRICEIRAAFNPMVNEFGASTTTTDLPQLLTAIDRDDATAPPNADVVRQMSTCQTSAYTEFQLRVIRPRFAVGAYSGTFTSFASSMPNQWIDTGSASVQHFGLKWAVTPVSLASGSYLLYNLTLTYVIEVRATI